MEASGGVPRAWLDSHIPPGLLQDVIRGSLCPLQNEHGNQSTPAASSPPLHFPGTRRPPCPEGDRTSSSSGPEGGRVPRLTPKYPLDSRCVLVFRSGDGDDVHPVHGVLVDILSDELDLIDRKKVEADKEFEITRAIRSCISGGRDDELEPEMCGGRPSSRLSLLPHGRPHLALPSRGRGSFATGILRPRRYGTAMRMTPMPSASAPNSQTSWRLGAMATGPLPRSSVARLATQSPSPPATATWTSGLRPPLKGSWSTCTTSTPRLQTCPLASALDVHSRAHGRSVGRSVKRESPC